METLRESQTREKASDPLDTREEKTPPTEIKPEEKTLSIEIKQEEKGDSSGWNDEKEERIQERIASLSIEDKVAQLLFVSLDGLTGVKDTTKAGNNTLSRLEEFPVGGILLFANNIVNPDQLQALTGRLQEGGLSDRGIPLFIGIDEEGGKVVRIAGKATFPEKNVGYMYELGRSGDSERARDAGRYIGAYLKRYGCNLDFAPVTDILTNPSNKVIGYRAFGSSPDIVGKMAGAFRRGLEENRVQSCLKHFPGHGDTYEDSHEGMAVQYKSIEELRECELLPFQEEVDAGADMIMAAHISLPKVLGNDRPASLSREILTDLLRKEMGYEGVIITDALNMGAIANRYRPEEACIMALEAGNDLLLFTDHLEEIHRAVVGAVKSGRISEKRIEESLTRILRLKMKWE